MGKREEGGSTLDVSGTDCLCASVFGCVRVLQRLPELRLHASHRYVWFYSFFTRHETEETRRCSWSAGGDAGKYGRGIEKRRTTKEEISVRWSGDGRLEGR